MCNSRIINIGNPDNEASIRDLAEMLLEKFDQHPLRSKFPPFAGFREIESRSYYGAGYQDVQHRRPSIKNAGKLLNWKPTIELEESVEQTLDFFLKEAIRHGVIEIKGDLTDAVATEILKPKQPAGTKVTPIVSVPSTGGKKIKKQIVP